MASDFQIFLRINWPQCMQLFYMCFCSFHVHESWYNVNIKILFLSDYWSGSRRVCPRPSRVTMVVVCRTCSCASVFSGQWVEARYAGVVSGHRGTVVYLLSSVMPKHYRSFYFRERIYLLLCFVFISVHMHAVDVTKIVKLLRHLRHLWKLWGRQYISRSWLFIDTNLIVHEWQAWTSMKADGSARVKPTGSHEAPIRLR